MVAGGRAATAPAESRLASLYRAHAPDSVRLAYLLTGDRRAAEDLVQDAFVRLASRFQDLRDPARVGGYLYRTILNLARGRHRRRVVERRYLSRRSTDATSTPAPDDEITNRDILWHAISSLPERQRAVVFFRYYQDLPERDVAEILSCSVGAVKSLNLRAMKKLREMVGGAPS